MFGHQRLLKAAMLALITPAAFVLVSDVRLHAATPSCATGEHTFDLSKDIPSGTAAVWLVPTGSFQDQITYYQLGHPEGRVWRRRQRLTNASSDRSARTCRILRHR